ncbi:hypothetical protein HDU87_007036 [Geranomyces variabilis]|uniref:Telomerase activating protein Est1 n=1 Tax=Geranomyces variabilis TaxID=109894 RepID=A0AAD5XNL8_9FUNG|nr:hypothetical protein HDU87_007036 [Geranomyces variabilis]
MEKSTWAGISIAELEKKLRYLLKRPASDGVFSEDVLQARVELRDALAVQILQNSDAVAAASGKEEDLEGNLWKVAHYKIIEEFRKAEKGVYSRAKRAGQAADRNELRLLTAHFRRFLSEATAFYARFICRLHRTFNLRGEAIATIIKQLSFAVGIDAEDESIVVATPVSDAAASRALKACHRSLIYLGDLARYREHHADRKATNWSAAVMFYNMAIRLIPENGNPYNQLAVIASHLGDELRAMECYTRSLAAERPFATASENLQILFEKVNKRSAGSALDLSLDDSSALQERFIVLGSKAIGKSPSFSEFLAVSEEWRASFARFIERDALDGTLTLKFFVIGLAMHHLSRNVEDLEWRGAIHEFLYSIVRIVFGTVATNLGKSSQRDQQGLLPTVMVMLAWLVMESRENPDAIMDDISLCEGVARLLNSLALGAGLDIPKTLDCRTTSEEADLAGFLPMRAYSAWLKSENNTAPTAGLVDENEGELLDDQHRTRRIVICGFMLADAKILSVIQERMRPPVFRAISKSGKTWSVSPTATKPQSGTTTISVDLQSYATPSTTMNASDDLEESENVAPGLKRSASGQPKVHWSATPTTTSVPTAATAAIGTAVPLPSIGGVDEDSFGRKIVLPSAGLGVFPFTQRKISAPIPVPRQSDDNFRTNSPDVTNMFGTSSDAVNTMSFLGLGSPDVRELARSRDPRAGISQASSTHRAPQLGNASSASPARLGDMRNTPGLTPLTAPLPPDPLSPLSKAPVSWNSESAFPAAAGAGRPAFAPTWLSNDTMVASAAANWTSSTSMVNNNLSGANMGIAAAQPLSWLSPGGYGTTAHSLAPPEEKDRMSAYSTTTQHHPSLWG